MTISLNGDDQDDMGPRAVAAQSRDFRKSTCGVEGNSVVQSSTAEVLLAAWPDDECSSCDDWSDHFLRLWSKRACRAQSGDPLSIEMLNGSECVLTGSEGKGATPK